MHGSCDQLDLVYNDEYLLVINKPKGQVMHSAPGHHDAATLAHQLLVCWPQLATIGGDALQPGMVHRLDKDTSGLVMIARSNEAYSALKQQMRNRKVQRLYLACVARKFEQGGLWCDALGRAGRQKMKVFKSSAFPYDGMIPVNHKLFDKRQEGRDFLKYAILRARGMHCTKTISLVECQLHTGLQHQIRCQFSYRGNPILGDDLYGRRNTHALSKGYGMTLHAHKLTFTHPVSGEVKVVTSYPNWLDAFCDEVCITRDLLRL